MQKKANQCLGIVVHRMHMQFNFPKTVYGQKSPRTIVPLSLYHLRQKIPHTIVTPDKGPPSPSIYSPIISNGLLIVLFDVICSQTK